MKSSLKNRAIVRRIASGMFTLSGRDVDTRWYSHFKRNELARVLGEPFDPVHLPPRYGLDIDERIVEYPWLFSRLSSAEGRLLDAGSVLNFDYLLAHPKLANKSISILTLAPEAECFWQRGVSYLFGDLRDTCFRDNYFDSVVCLSTLEHIGLDNTLFYSHDRRQKEQRHDTYMQGVLELHRILKPGGACFITLPFGKAETRSWLQIFDRALLRSLLQAFNPSAHVVTYFKYSARHGWQLSSSDAAANARYFDVHFDEPWHGCPAAAEAVVCLELVK